MLAEPRRKLKLSKDPNNLNWSNDDDKFGKRMLERMGWQKGKGLGANEDGKVDHISVRVKNDSTGVGCSKKHADNWIAHQDDFNSLLANLNADHSNSNSGTSTPAAEKVISLENHSKASKGRVHYQKFTRGKDLSGKNLEDLDCVFGRRKSKKKTAKTESDAVASKVTESDDKDKDNNYGVTTTTSKQSVQEYFAQKMAELQRSRSGDTKTADTGYSDYAKSAENSGMSELGVRYEDVEDDYRPSFSSKQQDHVDATSRNSEVVTGQEGKDEAVEGDVNVVQTGDLSESIKPSKKKSKKDRKKSKSTSSVGDGDGAAESESIEPRKKKRKRDKTGGRSNTEEESVSDCTAGDIDNNETVIDDGKDKKGTKRKAEVEEEDSSASGKPKKQKKSKTVQVEGMASVDEAGCVTGEEKGVKKKKKGNVEKMVEEEEKNSSSDKKPDSDKSVKTQPKKRKGKKGKKKGKKGKKKGNNVSPVKDGNLGKTPFKGANILEIGGYRCQPSVEIKKAAKKKTG